jgi:hypothetical protein
MISTHSYLNPSTKTRTKTPQRPTDGSSGDKVFATLVKPNAQVFMVLNGHFSGEHQQISTNAAGKPVYEMVADYQSRERGGDGWMRLMTFDPDAGQIRVRTYSPTLDKFETDANSQFTFSLDFNTRFGSADPVRTASFQQGFNGYASAVDTQLKQSSPATNYGSLSADLLVDDASSASATDASQVLLRFDNIFGTTAGKVPAGATILSAELVLNTTNPGDGAEIHRMVKTWAAANTWNTLVGGLHADGVEARPGYESQAGLQDLSATVPTGPVKISVTRDVQAWADGETTRGWAFLPWAGGTDGWAFSPSESTNAALRPQLRIQWVPGVTKVSSFQQGVSFRSAPGYSSATDTYLYAAEPGTRTDEEDMVVNDGPADNGTRQGLLKFGALFGQTGGKVPAGAIVEWARLYVTTPYTNANAPGAGADLHLVKQSWSSSATWESAFGGDGFQTNGIEAEQIADVDTGAVGFGSNAFDVTKSVRAWAAGEANNGWALLPNSSDAWMFSSADREIIGERPRLVVSWRMPGQTIKPAAAFARRFLAGPTESGQSAPALLSPPPEDAAIPTRDKRKFR